MNNKLPFLAILLLAAVLSSCAAQESSQPNSQPIPRGHPTQTARLTPGETTAETPIAPTMYITAEPVAVATSTTAAVSPTTVIPAGSSTITLNDNNKTITLHVGESFLLKLGEIYNWQINISDAGVLSRVTNVTVVRGTQGLYQAHQRGQIDLTAVGDPLCRSTKPACMMPSILFKITLRVE